MLLKLKQKKGKDKGTKKNTLTRNDHPARFTPASTLPEPARKNLPQRQNCVIALESLKQNKQEDIIKTIKTEGADYPEIGQIQLIHSHPKKKNIRHYTKTKTNPRQTEDHGGG